MELRSQLHSEEASARAALARQLLRDAQRPLSTLNTFGAMLTPRLEDGDIDKDMAEGIMLQVGLGALQLQLMLVRLSQSMQQHTSCCV